MGFAGGAIGSQQMGIDSPDGTLKNLSARTEAAHSTNASSHYNRLRSVDSNCATATRDEPTLSLQKMALSSEWRDAQAKSSAGSRPGAAAHNGSLNLPIADIGPFRRNAYERSATGSVCTGNH